MIAGSETTWHSHPFISSAIQKLRTIKPYKIILFGSRAYGKPNEDSDIDLIVVLNQRGISKTYREKQEKRKLVHKELLPIEREVSLDTLVYTRDEWTEFLKQQSAFSKLVNREGVLLYEDNHAWMAESGKRRPGCERWNYWNPHLTNIVAFHAQQSIEKTFKAVLEESRNDVPKTHSLVRLYALAKDKLNVEIDELLLAEINDVYIDARYPGELGLMPYGKPSLVKRVKGSSTSLNGSMMK